jgi:hypothetical protein
VHHPALVHAIIATDLAVEDAVAGEGEVEVEEEEEEEEEGFGGKSGGGRSYNAQTHSY